MSVDADSLKGLIERELELVSDARVVAHIRGLPVEPKVVMRDWNYGKPGEQYPCWSVLAHTASNTGISYCEYGFGPRCPWGLVWLGSEHPKHLSIGMDSGWFSRFMDAYFNSFASTDLVIWRVFEADSSGVREPITGEDTWERTWKQIDDLRESDPASRYDCGHSIAYTRTDT
jgi:hypothetical protein